ncbi:choice-of-anchor L domain-containing protein [Paenimyroides aestuarii]|uniref:Choice-of-anchor L domain-containing protein n=1 Tax=Paenimyroides aestuarii TaxID=2968490 RepID=A0ABY5NS02_9FLAO|nr:choice-of-anchor L domain-containing protein [Paenimyroides aestuarii]UUV21341.1 choice-of-anchor L domain-containing protein [Paenimyroides aestuarii]
MNLKKVKLLNDSTKKRINVQNLFWLFLFSFVINYLSLGQSLPTRINIPNSTPPVVPLGIGDFIEVNNASSAQSAFTVSQLINNVLISGGGNCTSANATNVVVSPNLPATNLNRSWGYFNKANANFPFQSGIVLSTGFARKAGNNFINPVLSDNLNSGGDVDLANVLNISPMVLYDATYIEFDFVPITNQITFNYILASEEYGDGYECSFTDAFALLLKKVGDPTYTNLAVLPNSGGVVSTSNIHPAVTGSAGSCGAVNQQYFGGYNTTNSDINFQGRTIPLTATATVIPGETYHFKMVIADYADDKYDTAVFLEAGSFDIGVKITDTAGNILPSNIKKCEATQVIKASVLATNATYKWFLNNVQIPGAISDSYTVTQTGTYSVEVTVPSSTCVSTASITVDNGTVPPLDLTDINGTILPSNLLLCETVNTTLKVTTSAANPTYQWYFNNTIISGATQSTYTATQIGNYSVKVASSNFDCPATAAVDVNITTLVLNTPVTLQGCSPTNTAVYNLTNAETSISTLSGVTYSYYENLADAQAINANTIAVPTAYSSVSKTIYAVASWGPCSKIAAIDLQTVLSPTIINQPVNQIVCLNNNATINVNAVNGVGYQWQVDTGSGFTNLSNNTVYSGVTTNSLTISNVTNSLNGYTYKVIVKSNCLNDLASNAVTLTVSQVKGSLTQTNVLCFGESNGSATVSGNGGLAPYSYLWSNNATTAAISGLSAGTYSVVITDANGCFGTETVVISQPTALTNVVNVKNLSCNNANDGTIEVIPSGGTLPYTYTWSHNTATTPKVTGLSAGTYTVTVKDAYNCIKTENITITEPNALSASITSKNVGCFATATGEAAITVIGGTEPYTYLWSNGGNTANISNISKGNYTVLVTDANGCSLTKAVTITEPNVLKVATTQTKAGCNGSLTNSVIAMPTGGTQPYTYSWSNGATTSTVDDLVPGNYTLTVSDANGCTVTESVTVVPNVGLSLNFSKKNVSCNGLADGNITATIVGGRAPYTYNWSNGATTASISNLSAGTYSLTITDDYGCTFSESVTIDQPDVLNIAYQQNNVLCYATTTGSISLNVTGGTPPYTYQWSNGNTSQNINQLPAGLYNVLVIDSKNCTASQNIYITQPIDIPQPVTTNQVFCINENATVSDLVVTGTDVKWYTTPFGGIPLSETQQLATGSYYASQTINGCENYTRAAINVTINTTNIPTGLSVQEFCEPYTPTVGDLNVNGQNIKWYDKATNGIPLSATTSLVNGTTYYATQTVNGCESTNRFAVVVNIYPSNPITTTSLVICNTALIQNISIDNFSSLQLKWYSSLTSTQALPSTHLLTNGVYYVSTFNYNLCESVRKPLQIITTAGVTVPIVSTQQVFCNTAYVSDLVANGMPGATINWYSSAQSVTPLAANTPLLTGTYYIEQEILPCKSPRIAVAVRVYPTTAPIMTDFVLCAGATVGDLYLKASTSTKYVWYVDNSSTTPLPDTYSLTTGYYYVAIDYSGCTSSRRQVHVKVNTRPNSPTGFLTQNFTHQAKVADLIMNQPYVTWYLSYNDAINRMNPLDVSDFLEDGVTYYGVIIDENGCPSYPTAVKVGITLSVNNFDLAGLKYYPNPVENDLIVSYKHTIESVEVYNIIGQRVLKQSNDNETVKINFSQFSSGTYMVKLFSEEHTQFIKIIKK